MKALECDFSREITKRDPRTFIKQIVRTYQVCPRCKRQLTPENTATALFRLGRIRRITRCGPCFDRELRTAGEAMERFDGRTLAPVAPRLKNPEQVECPECAGTGVVGDAECPVCDGHGTIESEEAESAKS